MPNKQEVKKCLIQSCAGKYNCQAHCPCDCHSTPNTNTTMEWEKEFDNKFRVYTEPRTYLTNRAIENAKLESHKQFIRSLIAEERRLAKREILQKMKVPEFTRDIMSRSQWNEKLSEIEKEL